MKCCDHECTNENAAVFEQEPATRCSCGEHGLCPKHDGSTVTLKGPLGNIAEVEKTRELWLMVDHYDPTTAEHDKVIDCKHCKSASRTPKMRSPLDCRAPQWAQDLGAGCAKPFVLKPWPQNELDYCGWCT